MSSKGTTAMSAEGRAPRPAPSAMRVRPATPADGPVVHAIERASFSDPWPETAFTSLAGEPLVYFPVAEIDGDVVGFAVLVVVADEAEVTNLAVREGARRGGVGAVLLDRLISEARHRGARAMYLDVRESNAAARGLYASRGFTEMGRRRRYYSAPVEDALSLRLGMPRTDPE